MTKKITGEKGIGQKGGQRGNRMWAAHSLEAVQKNAAIKPVKKEKKVSI